MGNIKTQIITELRKDGFLFKQKRPLGSENRNTYRGNRLSVHVTEAGTGPRIDHIREDSKNSRMEEMFQPKPHSHFATKRHHLGKGGCLIGNSQLLSPNGNMQGMWNNSNFAVVHRFKVI